jgi:hypothetical protein
MNSVNISHDDPEQLKRFKQAFLDERVCDEFIPCPQELKDTTSPNRDEQQAQALIEKYGYSDWYSFNLSEWGVKWDFGGPEECISKKSKENLLMMSFDTAWAPPLVLFEKLTEQGFEIEAFYYEPGMNFCGKWTSEFGDDYYEIPGTSDEVVDNIPTDIDEVFCISEQMAENEANEYEGETEEEDE